MINPRILEKFSKLPEQIQDAVSEYIEYLYDKYEGEAAQDEDLELTPEGEAFLRERMERAKQQPEQHKSWEEVKQEAQKKYGWKE